ncbi:DUF6278 family protein [Streptomyces sp. NPDC056716]|uniref:DUF6278 family protein n=1 Tax=unclassified Streptomyces TaxID=2593676 RepID=UPI0036CCBE63
MNIPFLSGRHRKRQGDSGSVAVASGGEGVRDLAGLSDLLAECELLRRQAAYAGVTLDDSAESLAALDQLLPRWRDDEETLIWLGTDAGLYLGTVIVRTVEGAAWNLWPSGQPVVRLASGREFDVVTDGHEWAASGVPELSQLYAEVAEA